MAIGLSCIWEPTDLQINVMKKKNDDFAKLRNRSQVASVQYLALLHGLSWACVTVLSVALLM